MSDLCEIEEKMKPIARYALTGFLGLLSTAYFWDYFTHGNEPFDLAIAFAFAVGIYAIVCWKS